MIDTEYIRNRLVKEFLLARTKNPRFSMRAYAKKLNIDQASLSRIMSGKRGVSKQMAETILINLGDEPLDVAKRLQESLGSTTTKCRPLQGDEFNIVSEWHHFAILSLSNTLEFKSDPAWIAGRLALPEALVSESIELLVRMGLLIKNESTGALQESDTHMEAISKIPSGALRKANEQNLELATKALAEIDVESRDFTALTLCFDPSNLGEARKMIKNFRRNFGELMETGQKKEVFKLCIQFFPLTRSPHV